MILLCVFDINITPPELSEAAGAVHATRASLCFIIYVHVHPVAATFSKCDVEGNQPVEPGSAGAADNTRVALHIKSDLHLYSAATTFVTRVLSKAAGAADNTRVALHFRSVLPH